MGSPAHTVDGPHHAFGAHGATRRVLPPCFGSSVAAPEPVERYGAVRWGAPWRKQGGTHHDGMHV